jgi:hypothetical protein
MTLGQSFSGFNPVLEPTGVVLFEGVDPLDEGEYHFRLVIRGRRLRGATGGAGLLACACVLWLAPAAAAAGNAQNSGVYDQYTEQIPTASGPHNTGSGGTPGSGGSGGGGTAIVLPASVKTEGGNDAKKLREVATSSRYGAPNATMSLSNSSAEGTAALSSAVNAVTDGSNGRMLGLFVALLLVTAVSLGAAAAARRHA